MSLRVESILSLFGAAALLATACTQTGEKTDPEKTEKAAPSTQPSEEATAPAEEWKEMSADELPAAAKTKLEEAKEAKMALAKTLMGELKAAIGKGDFARGVEACKEAAPMAKKKISEEYDVAIGRTSYKVRNPDNEPLDWHEPFVEERVKEDVMLVKGGEDLRYMSPIMTGEVCLNCHGTAEQIPDEVEKMLAEKYPEDEATGFATGDVRGWFWVEIAGG